ncbi:MAG TPA: WD40 repeat domain-containing protein [Methylovirgula sp.]|nr:WD40 repeat domain-containing protein [Methylovirgula sp.]
MKAGLINIGVGLLVAAAGLAISFGTYALARENGGHYYVTWGLVVVGGLQVLIGCGQFVRGLFTKEGRASLRNLFWPQSAAGVAARLGILVVAAGVFWIFAPESWKTVSPASLQSFSLRDDPDTVAYSPDGKWIAIAMGYGGLEILDANTGAEGKSPAAESYQDIQAVAFSPDGRSLAAATSSGLRIWSSSDWGSVTPTLAGKAADGNYAIAVSPDGKEIATGSVSRGILLWSGADGASLWRAGTDSIDAVAFSRDGARVASGSEYGDIKIWNAATGAALGALDNPDSGFAIGTLVFFRDGRLAAGGYEKPGVSIFEGATGKLLARLQTAPPLFGAQGNVWSIAISPDESRLAVGYTDRSIRIWDAKTYSLVRTIFGHAKDVKALAYAPNGHELASGGADHVLKVWASP